MPASIRVKYDPVLRKISRNPDKFINDNLEKIHEQVGKHLVGRQSGNKLPTGKNPNSLGTSTLARAPLAKAFSRFKNSNPGGFEAYNPAYRKKKEKAKKPSWLTVSGDMFDDMITNAHIIPTARGVTIVANNGKSSGYIELHFKGSGRIPKRNAYGAFNTADLKQIKVLYQNLLTLAFKGKAIIS